ncbi:MAG: hypothetical protein IJH90_02600 [Mogibacterium sp.]|nr:hypothetical protein [Mogibacterium sp.]
MFSKYKLRHWQNELTELSQETGITLEEVCDYLGVSYARDIGFYVKLPMKRRMYIGIGMAFGQPLQVINRWITTYGMKRRLYSKDISEDLVWIYLINRNLADQTSGTNYYHEYDRCQELAFETYLTYWKDIISGSADTPDLDKKLAEINYTEKFADLKDFVTDNLDSFKTSYAKSRRFLAQFLESILKVTGKASDRGREESLSSLRGWLDDSMINYLSGSADTINVIDLDTGKRAPDIKRVPKTRRSHIALALALGMTTSDLDRYLEMMGYLPLSEEDPDDRRLLMAIAKWEDEHPLQRKFKEKYVYGNKEIELDSEDEQQAVSDMLMLRQELLTEYRRNRDEFPYIKH